jgi:hypothetical protein
MKVGFGSVGFFRRACSFLDAPGDPLPSPSTLFLVGNRDPACQVQALGLLRYPVKAVPKGCRQKGSKCRFCRIKQGLASECRHQKGEVIDWGVGIRSFWNGMTEASGIQALLEFLEENNGQRMKMFDSNERHRADRRSTAIISPYVRFGQLSPRFIVHLAKKKYGHRVSQTFLRRLVWRDLAYWSLWRFPDLPTVSFRLQYEQDEIPLVHATVPTVLPHVPLLLRISSASGSSLIVVGGMTSSLLLSSSRSLLSLSLSSLSSSLLSSSSLVVV